MYRLINQASFWQVPLNVNNGGWSCSIGYKQTKTSRITILNIWKPGVHQSLWKLTYRKSPIENCSCLFTIIFTTIDMQFMNRPFNHQLPSKQSPGTFNHPEVRSDSSPSTSFTLPQLSINVLVILMAQYLSQLAEDKTLSAEEFHELIQNSKELFWQTYQESATIQPFFLTIDPSNLVHFASLATLPSKGSVKVVSSVTSLGDAINKGLGFLYQISKHNQHRETKLQVPHYLLLLSSPPGKNPEFCVMVTGEGI